MNALLAAVARVKLARVSDAFVAALVSAPLEYRSTLKSWAYARNFPRHSFVPTPESEYQCAICGLGEDAEVESVADAKRKGEFLPAAPEYALADLEHFLTLPKVAPTKEDRACLKRILATSAATGSALAARLEIPRTNKYSRDGFVETLGACGILDTPDHAGALTRFVSFWEATERPQLNSELEVPACFWRGSDGLNREAVARVFPGFQGKARRCPSRAVAGTSVKVRKLELNPGDLIELEFRGRKIRAVMLGADGKFPVVEFLGYRIGPFREAPRFRPDPLSLEGMELFGPVMPVKMSVVGRMKARKVSGFRRVLPRNLLYVLTRVLA